MRLITFTLDIDKPHDTRRTIYIGGGDKNGTRLTCPIYSNGERMTLTGGTVRFCMRKPHGLGTYESTGSVSSNQAVITIDEQQAADVLGVTDDAFLQVEKDGETLSTERLRVVILKGAR